MATTATTLEESIGQRTHGTLGWLMTRQTFWVFIAAVCAFVLMTLMSDVFATQQNLFNVTRNFAFVGIIALGMTAVIVTAGIDLSVGSTLALTGMVIGMSMNSGMLFWQALPLAIFTCLLVGAVNGVLIAYVGMPPFVVTLGMLSIGRSLAMVLSNNQMVFQFGPDQEQLTSLGGGSVTFDLPFLVPIVVPNPTIFLVVMALATGFALRWTKWGRHLFAIGGNEQAATLTGVPVKLTKVSVYMFSALCAGVTGILEVGWLGTITSGLGQGMELTVIAATVIGGANLMGGVGTAFGAVIGAALIEVIRNSLILLGISSFWHGTFVGTFIIVAVLFDRLRAFRSSE